MFEIGRRRRTTRPERDAAGGSVCVSRDHPRRDGHPRYERRSDRRGRTPTWSTSSVRSGATARSCNSGERDGASSHAHRVRRVPTCAREPISASARRRRARAQSHRRHPVALSPFRKSAACITATTALPHNAVGACRPTIIPAALPRCRSNPLTRVMNPNRGVALCEHCQFDASAPHIDFSVGTRLGVCALLLGGASFHPTLDTS